MTEQERDQLQAALHEATRALAWAVAELTLAESRADARHGRGEGDPYRHAKYSVEGALDQVNSAQVQLDLALLPAATDQATEQA